MVRASTSCTVPLSRRRRPERRRGGGGNRAVERRDEELAPARGRPERRRCGEGQTGLARTEAARTRSRGRDKVLARLSAPRPSWLLSAYCPFLSQREHNASCDMTPPCVSAPPVRDVRSRRIVAQELTLLPGLVRRAAAEESSIAVSSTQHAVGGLESLVAAQ